VDPAHVEKVEAELDRFIEKRARQAAELEHVEELWEESVRRDRERRREENREAWHGFHAHMQELHASLSEEHRAKAQALLDDPEGRGVRT
jgi:hypothetical protein